MINLAAKDITADGMRQRDAKTVNLAKVIITRVLEEVKQVSKTCSTKKQCKSLKDFIKKDQSLLLNQLVDKVSSGDRELGVALLGTVIQDSVKAFATKGNIADRTVRVNFIRQAKKFKKAANKKVKKTIGKGSLKQITASSQNVAPIRVY